MENICLCEFEELDDYMYTSQVSYCPYCGINLEEEIQQIEIEKNNCLKSYNEKINKLQNELIEEYREQLANKILEEYKTQSIIN